MPCKAQGLHDAAAAPTAGLWVVRRMYLILIAIHPKFAWTPFETILDFGHWNNADLMTLSIDPLVHKLVLVTINELC